LRFHQYVWSAQPNRILEKQLNSLCLPLFAYDLIERCHCAHLDFDRSARQHRMMIEVLSSRDGVRAEKLVRRLIRRFHRQDEQDFHASQQADKMESLHA
jgi:DNA-binding GntR family transcriptional regulator